MICKIMEINSNFLAAYLTLKSQLTCYNANGKLSLSAFIKLGITSIIDRFWNKKQD